MLRHQGLLNDVKYRWRVEAIDQYGARSRSQTADFQAHVSDSESWSAENAEPHVYSLQPDTSWTRLDDGNYLVHVPFVRMTTDCSQAGDDWLNAVLHNLNGSDIYTLHSIESLPYGVEDCACFEANTLLLHGVTYTPLKFIGDQPHITFQ